MHSARVLAVTLASVAAFACHRGSQGGATTAAVMTAPDDERIAQLRTFESSARNHLDYGRLPSSDRAMGADPWAIARIGGDRYVGILRGRDALVVLDAALEEKARLPAPRSPTGLTVSPEGDVYVAGSLDRTIARYHEGPHGFEQTGKLTLQGPVELRDLAWAADSRSLLALDAYGSRVVALSLGQTAAGGTIEYKRSDEGTCRGPISLLRLPHHRVDTCLFDHTVVVRDVAKNAALLTAKNDGPFWGAAAQELRDGSVVVAAGGVENRALDRREGFFGNVDSFVYLYKNGARIAEVNVSEHGVITPKALTVETSADGGIDVTVTGYGSDKMATVHVTNDATKEAVSVKPLVPGVRAMVRAAHGGWAMASSLLDAWVLTDGDKDVRVVRIKDEHDARSPDTRLGEALIFTSLMAPWNKSDGKFSRFTCETCHFEGYGDGRVHFTGRQDIHAATKPLFGLVGNKPHFSRALDPDLAAVAMNEFRVANAKNEHDPWFALDRSHFAWLTHLSITKDQLSPEELRRAFMTFLMDFSHRPHPALTGRVRFSDVERRGAEVFRDRCERCHAARLTADDPASHVPFEQWERWIFNDAAAIVWATSEYAKTGVTPYVNERGTRVPSLRRLYAKWPYFTNGSAKDIESILQRARLENGVLVQHDAPASDAEAGRLIPLDASAQSALRAFLSLL